jgi:BirA family biotin operon repressor/biotin-[acetyl-CoA-carboxylase] ligase
MRVLFLDEVDSTQRIALEWVQRREREWEAVCADHQTAGRGRRGFHWHDEPGTSLLVSLVLWDIPLPDPPGLLGVAAAIATAEVIDATFPPLQVRLKYPNDLMLHGRKLGGALVEIAESVAVVGIGVNLAQQAFPGPLNQTAISVWQALHFAQEGMRSSTQRGEGMASRERRLHLIEQIGSRLQDLATQVVHTGAGALYPLWQARDETPGRTYQILDLPGEPIGIALRVEPDFRLRLRLPDGSEHSTWLVHALSL